MHNDDARKVVTDENDVGDGSPEIKTQFALSAETKPRLKCKRSFREDLKISKKVLNVPSNGSVPGDMVVADVCSEISDDDVSNALAYWYRKGSEEVKKFNKPEHIARIAVEKDGILYSRSRIMDGHRFIMAAGFNKTSIGKEV